jgi:hypothetical protein
LKSIGKKTNEEMNKPVSISSSKNDQIIHLQAFKKISNRRSSKFPSEISFVRALGKSIGFQQRS